MSKRFRIFTQEDVSTHTSSASCWVSYKGKVYDVTPFLSDHPGGDDYILAHAGKDVEQVMKDKSEHDHSSSAYEMLEEHVIGRLGTDDSIVSDDWEATDDFNPDTTDEAKDFEKNQFLDLRKPLLRQVWEANWSKLYYLKQVHQPRHLPESARLFGPDILEMLTRTVWWVVPVIWAPISLYLYLRSTIQFTPSIPLTPFSTSPILPIPLLSSPTAALSHIPLSSFLKSGLCFALGVFIWTFIEYGMHRFLFHVDEILPDKPAFLTLHFLLHGIHHYLPMDRLRLVMPPILFAALSFPFTRLAYLIFPTSIANGIIAGSFAMYIVYDTMHYALHHTNLPKYMKELKKYHLAHHYKNFELGFGVTSKFWDVIFNTVLPL